VKFHYTAAAGTQNNGSLIAAVLADPDQPIIEGQINIAALTSAPGVKEWKLWENASCPMVHRPVPKLFVWNANSDPRLLSQGVFKLAALTTLNDVNLTLGTLDIEYVIEFSGEVNETNTDSKVCYSGVGNFETFTSAYYFLDKLTPVYNDDFQVVLYQADPGIMDLTAMGFNPGDEADIYIFLNMASSSSVDIMQLTGILNTTVTLNNNCPSTSTNRNVGYHWHIKCDEGASQHTVSLSITSTVGNSVISGNLVILKNPSGGWNFTPSVLDKTEVTALYSKVEEMYKFFKNFSLDAKANNNSSPVVELPEPYRSMLLKQRAP
jgi:hypothetical protein